MKPISLNSSARLSLIEVREIDKEKSVDIFYKSNDKVDGGVYNWEEVKQFVQELAEALDVPLEENAPEVEPIVLPKDVYEEVAEMRQDVVNSSNPKYTADYKLWDKCSSPKDSNVVSDWINNTSGATIDLAKILMGELPIKCEKEPVWLLEQAHNRGNFLCKACMNNTGGWALEFSGTPIHFPSRSQALDFAETVAYMVSLSVKEV
ncbi:hypothetical protein EG103P3_00012 [Enterococcus phage EG103P3]|nr:hypothetical protein EG103P3_00012 [Enterococcus phage EG103P3]